MEIRTFCRYWIWTRFYVCWKIINSISIKHFGGRWKPFSNSLWFPHHVSLYLVRMQFKMSIIYNAMILLQFSSSIDRSNRGTNANHTTWKCDNETHKDDKVWWTEILGRIHSVWMIEYKMEQDATFGCSANFGPRNQH